MASSCSLPSSDDCSSTQQPPSPLDSQCGIVDSPINGPCTSASLSTLPWLWVIQAVSCCQEIDISTLKELIDVAPVAKDDFCEKTRELIALRCLEDLFGHAYRIHVKDGVYGSLDPIPGLDFSRSCEDVFQQILDEKPLSDLKEVGAEFLKWDIFPFILHKRATVKSDLEQVLFPVLCSNLEQGVDTKNVTQIKACLFSICTSLMYELKPEIRAACTQVLFSAVYHLRSAVLPYASELLKISLNSLRNESEKERMAGAKLVASLMPSEDVIFEKISGGLLETRSVLSTILSSDPSPELRQICRQLLACITSS